jgi:TolA-binding protein
MIDSLISPFRRRIAQSFNWRVAQMKSDLMADSNTRMQQMQTQIDQLNMMLANMSVTFCDQQKVQAVLLERSSHRISALEKNAQTRSRIDD